MDAIRFFDALNLTRLAAQHRDSFFAYVKVQIGDRFVRSTIAVLLALLALPLEAQEWLKIASAEGDTYFLDQGSIRVNGNMRRVWTMISYKTRGSDGRLSIRHLVEIDCTEERLRILQSTTFSDAMLRGDLLRSYAGSGAWDFIAPGTTAESLLRSACAK